VPHRDPYRDDHRLVSFHRAYYTVSYCMDDSKTLCTENEDINLCKVPCTFGRPDHILKSILHDGKKFDRLIYMRHNF
jgi:hypothetical protein